MWQDYTVETLPDVWPGEPHVTRKRSPFKVIWTRTLDLLGREIHSLRGTNVRLALDITDYEINANGTARANARPKSPGIIVSFDTPRRGRLAFPCDTYHFWQENVHAVAVTLEKLRAVDRYGVQQGAQYAGFKQLPATTAPTMTANAAAATLAAYHPLLTAADVVRDFDHARVAWRVARGKTHPDAGGTVGDWHTVETAGRVLAAHFGRTL
jgi:hypothetical protein